MANRTGAKGNKGGSKRRNQFGIDWSQYEDLANTLEDLGADVKKIFTDVMDMEAETIQADTEEAVSNSNLPAQGKYSQGDTKKAIDLNPKTDWSGTTASICIGFDKTKPNAGTFLITGTPRMQPDRALEKIYTKKKYLSEVQKDIGDYFAETLHERIEKS